MQFTTHAGVILDATSSHLPEYRLTTAELFADSAELLALTGVEARHVAPPEHATSDLCALALGPIAAETEPPQRLIVATVTPDNPSPATAPLVAHRLGLGAASAFDISAACAGAVHAIDLAARFLATGDRRVHIAAGECRFRTLHAATPGVRVLFGDGAAAVSLRRADAPAHPGGLALSLLATATSADGSGHGAIIVPAGGSRLPTSAETVAAGQHALAMADGAHVFFKAVDGFTTIAADFLAAAGLTGADIDLVVPHQPNLRILERVARRLRIPLDRFQIEVPAIGNVGGASVLIALHRAAQSGRLRRGQKVLLLTAGAGYTAGVALFEVLSAPSEAASC